jgi:hypothetical protein
MSLSEAETRLEQHLTDRYADTDWRPALKAVMDAEGDIATALEAVDTLAATASQRTGLEIRIPARPKIPTQVTTLEIELMDSVGGLKSRNRIFGKPPTIEEIWTLLKRGKLVMIVITSFQVGITRLSRKFEDKWQLKGGISWRWIQIARTATKLKT